MNEKPLGKAIAFVGPPHSGKSVFLAELYRQLLANPQVGSKVFLQRACPDGEGMWSAEADQVLVKQLRQKGTFDDATMNFFISSIKGLRKNKPITIVDCGGRRSNQNAIILAECSDAVILSSKPEEIELWRAFCEENNVRVMAELHSKLLTAEQRAELDAALKEGRIPSTDLLSEVDISSVPFKGTMRDLDRDRPSITYAEAMKEIGNGFARECIENRENQEVTGEKKMMR